MSITEAGTAPGSRPRVPPEAPPSRSRPPGWPSVSEPSWRWTVSTWPCPRALSTACSGRTARARPPRSGSSPPCCSRRRAGARAGSRRGQGGRRRARRIALTGQFATVDEDLTGRENLVLLGRLLGLARRAARAARRRSCWRLSGSATSAAARSRPTPVACAAASTSPPASSSRPTCVPRRADHRPGPAQPRPGLGDRSARSSPAAPTVLLTTQYLDEADQLADRIAVIDHGTVIAEGTSGELKASVGCRNPPASGWPTPRTGRGAERMLTRLLGVTVQPGSTRLALTARIRPASRAASEQVAAAHYRACPRGHRRQRVRARPAEPRRGVPRPHRPRRRREPAPRRQRHDRVTTGSATASETLRLSLPVGPRPAPPGALSASLPSGGGPC